MVVLANNPIGKLKAYCKYFGLFIPGIIRQRFSQPLLCSLKPKFGV